MSEKIYRVQMNSKGMPNFSTAVEIADRPQGKWIRRESWSEGAGMGESYGFYYECSNCSKKIRGGYRDCGMNYCPNCGAEARGVSNETAND